MSTYNTLADAARAERPKLGSIGSRLAAARKRWNQKNGKLLDYADEAFHQLLGLARQFAIDVKKRIRSYMQAIPPSGAASILAQQADTAVLNPHHVQGGERLPGLPPQIPKASF